MGKKLLGIVGMRDENVGICGGKGKAEGKKRGGGKKTWGKKPGGGMRRKEKLHEKSWKRNDRKEKIWEKKSWKRERKSKEGKGRREEKTLEKSWKRNEERNEERGVWKSCCPRIPILKFPPGAGLGNSQYSQHSSKS